MSKRSLIITIALSLIGLSLEIGLTGFSGLLSWIVDIISLAGVVTGIGMLMRRSLSGFIPLFQRNALICGSIIGFFSSCLLIFAVLSNTFPSALSAITLTDGDRTIVFVQMSHIGTDTYYRAVNTSLRDLTRSGAIIYREGVRPGTLQSQARFDQMLGVKIGSGTYASIAGIMDMRAQDDMIFAGIATGSIRGVDLSLDEIVVLMGSGTHVKPSSAIVDPMREIEAMKNIGYGPLLPYFMRSLLNLSLRYSITSDLILDQIDPDFRDVILDRRNKYVIDTFLKGDDASIVIVYGALHFEGMNAYLKSRDPKWHIVSLKPFYPYGW